MLIFYGMMFREKKELWAGKTTCPCCGQQSDFYAHRRINSATLFFIPIVSFTAGKELVCENCDYRKNLKGKEYKELRKKQVEMIENGTYPKEKVLNDFAPENTPLLRETAMLILKGLLALMTLSPLLLITQNGEVTIAKVLLLLTVFLPVQLLFFLPFYFSLRRYLVLLKMKKAYTFRIF